MPEIFPTMPSPEWGVQVQTRSNVKRVQFGDGYSQRISYGLNSLHKSINLRWRNIDQEERDTVIEFLEARKGAESFFYTLPGESIARLWSCAQWQERLVDYRIYEINATFREEFDLDV